MIWSKICQSWQAEWWILFDILFSVLHGRERWTSLHGNISPFWTFGDFLSFVAATVLMVWRNVTSTSGATSHACHQFLRRESQCKNKFLWYAISIFLHIWYFWGNIFGGDIFWKYLSILFSPQGVRAVQVQAGRQLHLHCITQMQCGLLRHVHINLHLSVDIFRMQEKAFRRVSPWTETAVLSCQVI